MIYKQFTWTEFDEAVDGLRERLGRNRPRKLYAASNNGLVFAVALSYRLNVELILKPEQGMLVVDALADSGETLNKLINKFQCPSVVWLMRKGCKLKNVTHYEKIDEDCWPVLPWEEKLQAREAYQEYIKERLTGSMPFRQANQAL
jgi:xanthine phosphoribosyltransferase